MKVEIVPATPAHVIALCEALRAREQEAFMRAGMDPGREIVREAARSFVAYTGLIDGQVAIVWGAKVSGLLSDEAYVWVVCGQLIEKHPIVFLRHCHRALTDLAAPFKRLHGLVLADFDCSVRWLEWLGFEVGETTNGVRPFTMRGYQSPSLQA